MTFKEVFNGLAGEGDARLCNDLIVDWAAWSDSRTYGFLAEQLSDGNQVSLVHREDILTKLVFACRRRHDRRPSTYI